MASGLITVNTSTALQTALDVLDRLGLKDPPVTPEAILDGLNLSTQSLPAFDLARLTPMQRRQFGSVRGLLSPADRTIYLRDDLSARKGAWLIYHEAGHAFIEWHRRALYLDFDYTLSLAARQRMEREANEFAAHVQFFGSRFAADASDLPFGFGSVLDLASRYNASIESTVHQYIEIQADPVVCLVLQPDWADGGEPTLKAHYFVKPQSSRVHWDFGCEMGDLLKPSDRHVRTYYDGLLSDGGIHEQTVVTPSGERYLEQMFSNGMSVFILAKAV